MNTYARRDARAQTWGETGGEAGPRPVAIDAIAWGATLLTQLGLEPRAGRTIDRSPGR